MGSFLSRALIMVFGYTYPAYECFKAVEKNKPEIEQLMFWCQYWILVAMLTVIERVGDNLISWLPMYSEAKLAFFIYLWYPKSKGTKYIYDCFVRPFLAKNEKEIDHYLTDVKVKAGEFGWIYWTMISSYGQAKFFEILQYVSSQSPSQAHPDQQQEAYDEIEKLPGGSVPVAEDMVQEHQTLQPASDSERMLNEPESPIEKEDSVSSHQETLSKESTKLSGVKWRLMRRASNRDP